MKHFFTPNIFFLLCFFSAACCFNLSFSQISFQSSYTISPSTQCAPGVVAIGDVNNDKLNDVLMVTGSYNDPTNDRMLFVYPQTSSGTLGTPTKYTAYYGANAIAVADLNNDGLNDVVISYNDSIGIYFQNSNGTLNPIQDYYLPANSSCMTVGDLNNDGLQDIVVSCEDSLRIFYQQIGGGFKIVGYPNAGGNAGYGSGYAVMRVGDMNYDCKNDLVCRGGSPGGIAIYTQNNSGLLNNCVYTAAPNLSGMGIGDLNNDGRSDVAAGVYANSPNSAINIWYQDTSTHLLETPPVTETAFDLVEPLDITNFTPDGKNEIVCIHGGWLAMTIFSQDSYAQYSSYQKFSIPYASHYNMQSGMAIGDINNDGKKDVVLAAFCPGPNNGLIVLLNNSPFSGVSGGSGGSAGGMASVSITTPTTSICSGTQVSFTANPANGGTNPIYQWRIDRASQGVNDSAFSTTALNNGDTVICVMTSSAACISGSPATSNAIIMTVDVKGDAGVVTSLRDTVCLGTATHLSSNGASGNDYQWQLSTTGSFSDISGASSTTYATLPLNETTSYRLIAGSGACADTSLAVKVQVVNAPATVYSYTASDLKLSFSAVDSNNNIASYSWNFGDSTNSTEQNPTHTYAKEGTYYVCLTVYNNSNCSYTYCKDIDVVLNGVQSITGEGSWNVFPNPLNDYINIESLNAQAVESIIVYDVLGRKVIEKNFEKGNKQQHVSVDASSLAEGVYYLRIGNERESYTVPLVKQR